MNLQENKSKIVDFYPKLYKAERDHWWFHSRRRILTDLFWKDLNKENKRLNILSVGSSSGAEIEYLSKYGNVTGLDLDEDAVKFCSNKGLNILREDITKSSLLSESFDIVFAMDILEHVPDHEKALREIYRIVKKGGYLIITVPAGRFLWSKHDEQGAYPHKRRYRKRDLLNLLKTQNIKILKLSFYNFFFFPLIFLYRKVLRTFSLEQLKIPNKYINQICRFIFTSERYFLNKFNFPLGVSLIAICRKMEKVADKNDYINSIQKKCLSIVDLNRVRICGGRVCDKGLAIKGRQDKERKDFNFVGIKEELKKYPRIYSFLIKIISHSYCSDKVRNNLIKSSLKKGGIVLNVASGSMRIDKKAINLDLYAYSNVDIVADATNLCLKNESVDLIVNQASLEHIYDYKKVITETYRVLKKGGRGYFTVPFLYEFHASPNDFHRFTSEGLKRSFQESGFVVEDLKPSSGPASSFVGVLIEFLSVLLSFGIKHLYKFLTIFFLLIFFPIKFLDYFFNRFSFSKNAASCFYAVIKK